MNARQKAFAEYYIQTRNAAESARRAGYSVKGADRAGERILRNIEVAAYISERTKAFEEKLIADSNEIMQFLSDAMRGKVKDQFGLDASLSDRMTAARELQKIHDAGARKNTDELDKSLTIALTEAAHKVGGRDGDIPV